MPYEVSYLRLWEVWFSQDATVSLDSVEGVVAHVCKELNILAEDEGKYESVKYSVTKVCYRIRSRWLKHCRNSRGLLAAEKTWLETTVTFGLPSGLPPMKKRGRGRPTVPVADASHKTKVRRVCNLRNLGNAQELSLAAEMNARAEGKTDAAKIMHELMQTSPSRPSKMRAALDAQKCKKDILPFSCDEALSLFLEGDMSNSVYQLMRNAAVSKNAKGLYPPYKRIKEAKDRCIPENLLISETCAEVKLQALIDNTGRRLVEVLLPVLKTLSPEENNSLLLRVKFGLDGTSDQSNYKQMFEGDTVDDSSIIITSMVPMQLIVQRSEKVVWHNIKSSSTRFCRLMRLQFAKETKEFTLKECDSVDREIKALVPTVAQHGSVTVTIKHEFQCSMIDGKVCSALTGISTQRCVVCGAYPSEFNDIDKMLTKEPNPDTFEFGLYPLHCYIRRDF